MVASRVLLLLVPHPPCPLHYSYPTYYPAVYQPSETSKTLQICLLPSLYALCNCLAKGPVSLYSTPQ